MLKRDMRQEKRRIKERKGGDVHVVTIIAIKQLFNENEKNFKRESISGKN